MTQRDMTQREIFDLRFKTFKENLLSISEEDLWYAAGFIDGEGCFSCRGKYQIVGVSVANTYKPVIEWFLETFGGKTSVSIPRDKHPKYRNVYNWYIGGRSSVEFCKIISPYLKEKSVQALGLIAIHQLKGKPGQKISQEINLERIRLCKLIKEAKGRWQNE